MNIRKNLIFRSKMIGRFGLTLFMAALLTMVMLLPGVGQAVEILPGYDYILTQPGTQFVYQGLTIPLESFPYSNPGAKALWDNPPPPPPPITVVFQTHWFDPHHVEVQPGDKHAVSQVTEPTEIQNENFDTIVQRLDKVTMGGVGSQGQTGLEIVWLSLKSTYTYNIPAIGEVEFYVGLKSPTQKIGVMGLESNTADGHAGLINLGHVDDPGGKVNGLPVDWEVVAIPIGLPIDKSNIVFSDFGYDPFVNTWGGQTTPTYNEIPLPPSALLFASGLLGLVGWRRFK